MSKHRRRQASSAPFIEIVPEPPEDPVLARLDAIITLLQQANESLLICAKWTEERHHGTWG